MEHLSNDHEERPNHHENSHKQCSETMHLIVNMMERQWKLRQHNDQNFLMEGKLLYNKYYIQKKERHQKE